MATGMEYNNGAFEFNGKALALAAYDPRVFTYEAHKSFIEKAKQKGFEFIGMNDSHSHNRTIILQHNINYSLGAAKAIAEVERESKIKSTFFVMLTSPFYSLENESERTILKDIVNMGHELGLLIIPRDDEGKMMDEQALMQKTEIIVNACRSYGITPSVVAYDTVGAEAKRLATLKNIRVAGVRVTHGHAFADEIDRSTNYIANSNGLYLYGTTPTEAIGRDGEVHLHLLLHPEWITREPKLPFERLQEHVEVEKWESLRQRYLRFVPETNRCVVGDGTKPDLDNLVRQCLAPSRHIKFGQGRQHNYE